MQSQPHNIIGLDPDNDHQEVDDINKDVEFRSPYLVKHELEHDRGGYTTIFFLG
jgi:hypothetical protein